MRYAKYLLLFIALLIPAYGGARFTTAATTTLTIADADIWSFTDGAGTDKSFTITALVNMTDATSFSIINKDDGLANREFTFRTTSSDLLTLILLTSTSNQIARRVSTALTAYEGQWIHVGATYNANKTNAGIKLYLNGVQVDDTDGNAGTYTGMSNSNAPVRIGTTQSASPTYADGSIAGVCVYNRELTAGEMMTAYAMQGAFCMTASGVIDYWPMIGPHDVAMGTIKGVRGGYEAVPGAGAAAPIYINAPQRVIMQRR
jgi:hypothetical protein